MSLFSASESLSLCNSAIYKLMIFDIDGDIIIGLYTSRLCVRWRPRDEDAETDTAAAALSLI